MLGETSAYIFNKNSTFGDFTKEKIIVFTNMVLSLLCINLLAENFGIFSYNISRLCAFVLMAGIIYINVPIRINFYKKLELYFFNLILGSTLSILSLFIMFHFGNSLIGLLSFSIFMLGLTVFLEGINKFRREFWLSIITTFFFTLFMIFAKRISIVWLWIQKLSLSASHFAELLAGKIALGPSISGLDILISFLLFLLVFVFYIKRNKKYKIKILPLIICYSSILIIIWFIYLVVLSAIQIHSPDVLIKLKYFLFLVLLIPLFHIIFRYDIMEIEIFGKKNFKDIKKKNLLRKWETTAIIILTLYSIISIATYAYGESDGGTVTLYKPNIGSFDIPHYGNYGRYASGFFGLLPYYLNISGFSTQVTDNITQEILNESNVLVIININETFTKKEFDMIWDFVDDGGSLLVLGDHTNISGIMDTLNNLLKPVGIKYKFDAALSLKNHWTECYSLMNHQITQKIRNDNEVGISVGASLELSASAFPIIIGKYGYSDRGDPLKISNAFLGDYEYEPGEQLGDVILCAGAYYGKGKVIVFGDTSTFQNPVIPYSYSTVSGVFSWLSNSRTKSLDYAQIVMSIIALIIAFYIYFRTKITALLSIFPLFICISLLLSTFINPILLGKENITGPVAYIDCSHNELINLEPYTDDSVDGLVLNLARNGYLPIIMRSFSSKQLLDGEILVLIAPMKNFTPKEIERIEQFVSKGGLLIICSGFHEKWSITPLLKKFGLDIVNIPLGPIPYTEESPTYHQMEPRFVESYPIVYQNDNTNISTFYQVNISGKYYNIIIFKEIGNGGLLLIGDARFLLNKNLESLFEYWPGNVKLFRDMFLELREEGVLK